MKNIVNVAYVEKNRDKIILVDSTNNFLEPEEGKSRYKARHIEGAFHVDLYEDMCGEEDIHGGRNPLPSGMVKFKERLESMGAENDSIIVTYDENMVTASRFWWMCKYIGLEKVYLLDGGINAWTKAGNPLTAKVPEVPTKGHIDMNINERIIATVEDVKKATEERSIVLGDCRTNIRYTGEREVINKKAGHIPSAMNYFYGEVLENCYFKGVDFIKAHFAGLEKYRDVIMYCGSGVSAPINIIALDEIGVTARLYVGSWSDYISYDENEIASDFK